MADFGLALPFEAGKSAGDTHGQVGSTVLHLQLVKNKIICSILGGQNLKNVSHVLGKIYPIFSTKIAKVYLGNFSRSTYLLSRSKQVALQCKQAGRKETDCNAAN